MVAPAIALWAGLWSSGGAGAWGLALAIVVALAMGALAIRAPDRVGTMALTLAALAVGIARGAAHDATPALPPSWEPDRRPIAIEARVIGHPWRIVDGRVAVLHVLGAEDRCLVGIRVRARLPAGAAVEWGDRVTALVQIERPPARRSPGGYDARAALAAQGIAALGRAVTIRRAALNVATWERATCARARRAVEAALDKRLSPAAREVVMPLVVGDRGELGAELGADLQAAGLTHLIALSGLHVTWMAAIMRGAAALAGAGPVPRALAGALCALAYVGIAGPLPSLARAAVTEGVLTWARVRDRPLDPIQALAVSVVVLLALCPGWAGDLGFQLSCAATAGLTTAGAALGGRLATSRGIGAAMLRLLVPTSAAQLGAQPLLMARFHALPWTALAANLLAVPVCELALAAAWLGVMLEGLWPGGGATMFAACEALCAALRAIAATAGAAPLALLPLGHHAGAVCLASLAAAAIAIATAPGRSVPRGPTPAALLAIGATLTLISVGFAATSPALRPPPGRWWLVALDVGQGDALALGLDDGWWLVDAGPRTPHFDAGSSVVLPFLRWAGVRRLRGVIVTHNHGDHAGGVRRVLTGVPAGRVVVRAGWPPPGLPRGVSPHPAAMGDTLHHDPALIVRWPPRHARGSDENAGSLVLEVGTGAGRALLAADVDSLIEAALAVAPGLSVLKVAHHGAGRSSGSGALARWRPRHAIVSCGRRNPFGHPDEGALERLTHAGAEVCRTDREGTVWLEMDPQGVRRVDWRRAAALARDAAPTRAATGPGPLAAAPPHW